MALPRVESGGFGIEYQLAHEPAGMDRDGPWSAPLIDGTS